MGQIEKIHYNWHQSADCDSATEDFYSYTVGEESVTKITEHKAIGEGDRWFYDVHFESGAMERIFNPNQIFYKSE